MKRAILGRGFSSVFGWRMLGAAILAAGMLAPVLMAADTQPGATSKPADTITLKGTSTFSGTKTTWTATLTAKGENVYDAAYTSSWGGKPLEYKGTIKTDLKTTISGDGVCTGKNGNGKFAFAGKFGDDGGAKCAYKEIGGGRSGSMTVDAPK